jgi:hypothetical protein
MSEETSTVRAVAWDPRRPAVLLIPTASSKEGQQACMHTFSAHTGSGCNEYELSALLKVVKAYEETTAASDLQRLFGSYRAAVSECIDEWSEALQQQEDAREEELMNLDLLQMDYAVLHLSHVFLPLLPSKQQRDNTNNSEEHWDPRYRDPFGIPGLATAATVRYLRHNHTLAMMETTIEELLHAAQPECYPNYWHTVTVLVLRGCLEDAWRLLANHSLYVAATSLLRHIDNDNDDHSNHHHHHADPQYVETMREIAQGFVLLRQILLLAPLPGGRSDRNDNALGVHYDDDDDDLVEELQDLPVTPLDYKFWEPSNHNTASSSSSVSRDLPLDFQADAAQRKHQLWQEFIKDNALLDSSLSRHVPEIRSILTILSGDLRECSVNYLNNNWAEALLAELLYRQPAILPRNLGARAARIVSAQENNDNSSNNNSNPLVHALLQIMQGNAGHAIELLFLTGGGTGAPLPATLVRSVPAVRVKCVCAVCVK